MSAGNTLKRMRKAAPMLLWSLLVCFISFQNKFNASASEISSPPPRAAEAVSTLKMHQWEKLEDGLMLHQASTALGTRFTTLKISLEEFRFSIEQQATPMGERASSALERTNAKIAINGGFFGQSDDGSLFPVGQLVDNGASHSGAWSSVGGYLAIDTDGMPDISVSSDGVPSNAVDAVQTKPVLIEAGGLWAMNTNGNEPEWRSLVCILADGDVLLVAVSGGGLTLYEAGWVLRAPKWGGFYDCDRAIALDGGGSTQLEVRDHPRLKISGLTPVQNLLLVDKR
jgi:exopolysaccharide biosynthesis protein